ncbi:hypothetical protein QR680_009430 [Steinernema hermaphroditum]|uniref:SNF-related serine/threonine-protein kinase n=1 Tax=Steinernema hermaphroditum TaxID=289476 RepID=A0AA39IK79_9BILA|nr:hypothetical protein QR680_009430 [Steinernema hermaphroditum]
MSTKLRRKISLHDTRIAGLYDLETTIGKGHFAVVKLARHVFTGEKVAVKIIDKTKLEPVSTNHIMQEVRCMKLVQHPNIVRLYEVIDTQTKLFLILELGDYDMYDFILKHGEEGCKEPIAQQYFSQIIKAIDYCHALHVVHRDLKPENVVFFEKLGMVKLTDFGFSNLFVPGEHLRTSCGSLAYSAPEILLGDSYDAPAVDVWSLGVILYMLVSGKLPFEEANESETLTQILDCRYKRPEGVSDACCDLIAKMLVRDPAKRATLEELTANPWVVAGDRGHAEALPLIAREHLPDEAHTTIIEQMVAGGIGSEQEILSAIENDDYTYLTATYYLLAERVLSTYREEQASRLAAEAVLETELEAAADASFDSNASSPAALPSLQSQTSTPIYRSRSRSNSWRGSAGPARRPCSILKEESEEELSTYLRSSSRQSSSCSSSEASDDDSNERRLNLLSMKYCKHSDDRNDDEDPPQAGSTSLGSSRKPTSSTPQISISTETSSGTSKPQNSSSSDGKTAAADGSSNTAALDPSLLIGKLDRLKLHTIMESPSNANHLPNNNSFLRYQFLASSRFGSTCLPWPQKNPSVSSNLADIESHWANRLAAVEHIPSGRPPKYILSMFPYPSGRLHMGHMRVYTISDVLARYYRLNGFDVIHPIGWDAFGLPAENAARDHGVDPREWTYANIDAMKDQLKRTGVDFDWNREFLTCDPKFYQWTQWIFCKLFEKGLVRRSMAEVHWDPVDQTVLAAEQIDANGRSWRSGALAERRRLRQWAVETPKYAKELLEGLDKLPEWKEVADIQANWIGKCDVYRFHLPLRVGLPNITAMNVITGVQMPIVVSPRVNEGGKESFLNARLGFSDNSEDCALIRQLNLVVTPRRLNLSHDDVVEIAEFGAYGGYQTSRTLVDWVVSRQRKWGTPIPMVISKDGRQATPVPYDSLAEGAGIVETDTLDTFFDSSWYYLRYLDVNNKSALVDYELTKKLMPVDVYVGGIEHAAIHMFFARFVSYFLNDIGASAVREPFSRLVPQGIVRGKTFIRPDTGEYVKSDLVKPCGNEFVGPNGEMLDVVFEKMSKSKHNGVDPLVVLERDGIDLARLQLLDSAAPRAPINWGDSDLKGLKKWLDRVAWVVNTYVEQRGAAHAESPKFASQETEDKYKESYNYFVRNASMLLEVLHLHNTAIARLQGLTNALRKIHPDDARNSVHFERCVHALVIMTQVFAPHTAAEFWAALCSVPATKDAEWNRSGFVWEQRWPQVDRDADIDFIVTVGEVNCGRIAAPREQVEAASPDELRALAESRYHSSLFHHMKHKGFAVRGYNVQKRDGFHVTLNVSIDEGVDEAEIRAILDTVAKESPDFPDSTLEAQMSSKNGVGFWGPSSPLYTFADATQFPFRSPFQLPPAMSSLRRLLSRRGILIGSAALGTTIGGLWYIDSSNPRRFKRQVANYFRTAHAIDSEDIKAELNKRPSGQLPTRKEILDSLNSGEVFDVLVIGGGATGAGVALDSQTRGLKTALVELNDFSSGTSSRSTKLIHGGVRYLQAAVFGLDLEQYRMVKEALFERANLLEIAPHLSCPLPIMLPVYKWWQVPYYWAGIKMYDFVSGKRVLKHSFYINKEKALERFPMLKKESLKGALIYYDGQHNDARMNLAIVLTAVRHGAKCANHIKVERLLKDSEGKVCGAHVKDMVSGVEWDIKAKAVINATGPFTDSIRLMADPDTKPICQPSSGVHIVLPGYYSPGNTGLLDPATSDGRVIFFLPWERMTVAGTTDAHSEVTFSPKPSDQEIEFILQEIRGYLSKDVSVRRGDVMSAWAGLRPLVRDPNKKDTKSLARNHIIEVSDSNLITIAGGKWTTYRHMAEEAVDAAVRACDLSPRNDCVTPGLMLEGAHEYDPLLYIHLVQDYGMEVDVAQHLANTYGDRAFVVARMCKMTGKRWPIVGHRLHDEFPYLDAEVQYAVREYACNAVDVIARRLRLAFLNTYAAHEVLPAVVEIMAKELNWNKAEIRRQLEMARDFINQEMGQDARATSVSQISLNLTREEMDSAKAKFNALDWDRKGHITVNDLRKHFRDRGEKIDERLLHELLNEVDLNKNGELELAEFFLLYSGLKGGQIAQNRLVRYLDEFQPATSPATKITVARSGGGV